MNPARVILLLAGLAGLSAVILAALGSHTVPGLDTPDNLRAWQTAVQFHLVHAVVLLVLSQVYKTAGSKTIFLAAVLFFVGVILFSGSIYISYMSQYSNVRRFAPMGGLSLMLGWVLIVIHAIRDRS